MANTGYSNWTLSFVALILSTSAFGEIWLPTEDRYKAQEKRQVCADIMSAQAKIEGAIPARENEIETLTLEVKELWGRFEACAKEKGIPQIRNEMDEAKAANECELEHKRWQSRGFNLVVGMKELEENKKTVKQLEDQSKLYCLK